MKVTIIILTIMLGFINAKAQINKGTSLIGFGGLINYSSFKSDYVKRLQFGVKVEPTFEYFVKQNLSIGTGLFYNPKYTRDEVGYNRSNPNSSSTTKTIYGATIYVKKYWFAYPKLSFFLMPQFSNNYFQSEESSSSYTNIYKYNYWYQTFSTNIGMLYFIKPHIFIDVKINAFQIDNGGPEDWSKYFSVNNDELMFGLKYLLRSRTNKTPQ